MDQTVMRPNIHLHNRHFISSGLNLLSFSKGRPYPACKDICVIIPLKFDPLLCRTRVHFWANISSTSQLLRGTKNGLQISAWESDKSRLWASKSIWSTHCRRNKMPVTPAHSLHVSPPPKLNSCGCFTILVARGFQQKFWIVPGILNFACLDYN